MSPWFSVSYDVYGLKLDALRRLIRTGGQKAGKWRVISVDTPLRLVIHMTDKTQQHTNERTTVRIPVQVEMGLREDGDETRIRA